MLKQKINKTKQLYTNKVIARDIHHETYLPRSSITRLQLGLQSQLALDLNHFTKHANKFYM